MITNKILEKPKRIKEEIRQIEMKIENLQRKKKIL